MNCTCIQDISLSGGNLYNFIAIVCHLILGLVHYFQNSINLFIKRLKKSDCFCFGRKVFDSEMSGSPTEKKNKYGTTKDLVEVKIEK